MRNTKYAHMGINELKVRVLAKYQEVLKSDKLIYVVGKNNYFGDDYGAFDEETIKDFHREDLEIMLSNKYSALKFIELDNIIVLHDGNAEQAILDDELVVWTGKIKRDGSKELLYGKGSWTWREAITLNEYRKTVRSKVDEIIKSLKDYTDNKNIDTEVKEYYASLLEDGTPIMDKVIVNDDNYIIALSNTSYEYFDLERLRSYKHLNDFCYPKLKIEFKKPGNLTELELINLSSEELSSDRQKQLEKMLDKRIVQLLDTNEIQIKNIGIYNLSFSLWNHKIYLAFDSVNSGEMRYEIYNELSGTRWQGKLYNATSSYFSLYKEKMSIAQERFLGSFIKESIPAAKEDLRNYFIFKCNNFDNGNLMTEIVIRFILKTDIAGLKNNKEEIMNLFK